MHWTLSWYSGFLPVSTNMRVRLTEDSKLTWREEWVCIVICHCVGPVMDWWSIQVCPASDKLVTGIARGLPWPWKGWRGKKKELNCVCTVTLGGCWSVWANNSLASYLDLFAFILSSWRKIACCLSRLIFLHIFALLNKYYSWHEMSLCVILLTRRKISVRADTVESIFDQIWSKCPLK